MMELVSDAYSFFEIYSPQLDLYLFLTEVDGRKFPFIRENVGRKNGQNCVVLVPLIF